MRWLQVAVLPVLFVLGIVVAVDSYRSIDRELTAAAASRRTSLSYLAAITLNEKLDRMVDVGVSLRDASALPGAGGGGQVGGRGEDHGRRAR